MVSRELFRVVYSTEGQCAIVVCYVIQAWYRHGIVKGSNFFSEFESVHLGHINIGKAAIDAFLRKNFKCLNTGSGGQRLIAFAPEVFAGNVQNALFIIYKQNCFFLFHVHWQAFAKAGEGLLFSILKIISEDYNYNGLSIRLSVISTHRVKTLAMIITAFAD